MMRREDGSPRPLLDSEKEEVEENVAEAEAAEALRAKVAELWKDLQAASCKDWETWMAAEGAIPTGEVKRARVHVLVQGERGRIIKNGNYLIGLKQGEEFFSYSVNVHADDGECEPTASTSQPDVAPGVLRDVVDTQIDNEAGPDKGFEMTE